MNNIFAHTVRFAFASTLLLSVSSCYPDIYEEGDKYLEAIEHSQGGSHAAAAPHGEEKAKGHDDHGSDDHAGDDHDEHKEEHKDSGH